MAEIHPHAPSSRPPRWLWVLAAAACLAAVGVGAWFLRLAEPTLRLGRAPEATVAAGTARVEIVTTVSGLGFVPELRLDVARGEMDLQAQQARLVREVPGLASLPFIGTRIEPVELRYDGGDVYIRLPAGDAPAWVRVREAEEPAQAGWTGGVGNPAGFLGMLTILDGTPEELGEEHVGDVPTTRYHLVVDLDEAIARLGENASRVAEGIRLLHGRARLPMDVWLDGDDRIRRLRYVVRADLRGVVDLVVETDMQLGGFGLPVDTAPPSASELVELPDVRPPVVDPLGLLRDLLERAPRR
jgi:hypothetical protein